MNYVVVSKTRLVERSFIDRFGPEGLRWKRIPPVVTESDKSSVTLAYAYSFRDIEDALVAKILAT